MVVPGTVVIERLVCIYITGYGFPIFPACAEASKILWPAIFKRLSTQVMRMVEAQARDMQ